MPLYSLIVLMLRIYSLTHPIRLQLYDDQYRRSEKCFCVSSVWSVAVYDMTESDFAVVVFLSLEFSLEKYKFSFFV